MRRVLAFVVCTSALILSANGAPAQSNAFQRTPESGAAGTTITVSAAGCNQPLAGAGLVGNPGGVTAVQAETAPMSSGAWSVQLVVPQGANPNLDYVVVARCGNPDAGGFFYSPDLPFDVLPAPAQGVTGQMRMTG